MTKLVWLGPAPIGPRICKAGVWTFARQGITGNWSVVCSRGTSAASKSGSFKGRTTLHVYLKFPFAHPDSCTEAVIAELNGSGRIHVWVTGKRLAPSTAARSPSPPVRRPHGEGSLAAGF